MSHVVVDDKDFRIAIQPIPTENMAGNIAVPAVNFQSELNKNDNTMEASGNKIIEGGNSISPHKPNQMVPTKRRRGRPPKYRRILNIKRFRKKFEEEELKRSIMKTKERSPKPKAKKVAYEQRREQYLTRKKIGNSENKVNVDVEKVVTTLQQKTTTDLSASIDGFEKPQGGKILSELGSLHKKERKREQNNGKNKAIPLPSYKLVDLNSLRACIEKGTSCKCGGTLKVFEIDRKPITSIIIECQRKSSCGKRMETVH